MIVQDLIVSRLLTLLTGATGLDDVRIEDDVDFGAMEKGEDLAIEVQLDASTAENRYAGGTAPTDWTSRIRITCGARADKLHPVNGRKTSVLLAAVHAAIGTDPHLGGLLVRELLIDGMQRDFERADSAIGVLAAIYSCEHQTTWNSLTA